MKNKPAFPRAGVPSFGVEGGPCVMCGFPIACDWWMLIPKHGVEGWYWSCNTILDCADRQAQRAAQTAAGGA